MGGPSLGVATPSPLSVVAASVALSVLSVVAVALRFWARHVQRATLLMDDWLLVPALVSLQNSQFQRAPVCHG